MSGLIGSGMGSVAQVTIVEKEDNKHVRSWIRNFFSIFNCGAGPKSYYKYGGSLHLETQVKKTPENIGKRFILIRRDGKNDSARGNSEREIDVIDGHNEYFENSMRNEPEIILSSHFLTSDQKTIPDRMVAIYNKCCEHPHNLRHADVRLEIKIDYDRQVNARLISGFTEIKIEIAGALRETDEKIREKIQQCCDDNKSLRRALEAISRWLPGKDVRFSQSSEESLTISIGDLLGKGRDYSSGIKKSQRIHKAITSIGRGCQEMSGASTRSIKQLRFDADKKELNYLLMYQVAIANKTNQLAYTKEVKHEIQKINFRTHSEWSSLLLEAYSNAIKSGEEELNRYYVYYQRCVSKLINDKVIS